MGSYLRVLVKGFIYIECVLSEWGKAAAWAIRR